MNKEHTCLVHCIKACCVLKKLFESESTRLGLVFKQLTLDPANDNA